MLKASLEWEHDDDQAVWDRGIARVIVVMVSTISLFYKYLLAFSKVDSGTSSAAAALRMISAVTSAIITLYTYI